jgi:heat shock protein HslJ
MVLVGLAIMSACSMESKTLDSTTSTLAGTQWNLQTLDGKTVKNSRPLTISFEDGRLNGFSGCNRFFGHYTDSTDGVFSTGQLGATKMACGDGRDQLEQHYLEQLAASKLYAISLGQLHLLDPKRKILMVFTAEKQTHSR